MSDSPRQSPLSPPVNLRDVQVFQVQVNVLVPVPPLTEEEWMQGVPETIAAERASELLKSDPDACDWTQASHQDAEYWGEACDLRAEHTESWPQEWLEEWRGVESVS